MAVSFTLAELARSVDGRVRGDANVRVEGVATIADAGPRDLTWMSDARFAARLADSQAGAVVTKPELDPTSIPAIVVDDPDRAIAGILGRFAPPPAHPPPGVHETAVVDPTAQLGEGVAVGPHVTIGEDAVIGDRTILHAHVVIGMSCEIGEECVFWPGVVVRERCHLGDRVVCHPNATIGADGFGYYFTGARHEKIPQIGTVVIESDVEIGAGSCIDRAKCGVTRIGQGVKIDNLVQIAHNVTIGPHSILVAQVGVAGSARLGSGVIMGGKVGVRDHVVIGNRAQAAACCCISKDVPAGSVVNGIPAIDNRQYLREQAQVRRLPESMSLLKDLVRRVEQLEAAANNKASD